MSFVGVLKKIGAIAGAAGPEVISMVNPPMGALAAVVLNSVLLAEAKNGSGNGPIKKLDALSGVQVALPLLLAVMQQSTGKALVDPEALVNGVEKINDGIVDILNGFRVLPKN